MLNLSIGARLEVDGNTYIVSEVGKAGHAVYGPYQQCVEGMYEVEFDIALADGATAESASMCAAIDVVTEFGQVVLARREIAVSELVNRATPFKLSFQVDEPKTLEYRVFCSGETSLVVAENRKVTELGCILDPISDEDQPADGSFDLGSIAARMERLERQIQVLANRQTIGLSGLRKSLGSLNIDKAGNIDKPGSLRPQIVEDFGSRGRDASMLMGKVASFARRLPRLVSTADNGASRSVGVTADDIVSAIEMILGRTPDQALVDYHLSLGFADRFALGRYILNTDEVRARFRTESRQHFFLGDRVLAATHRGQYMYLVPTDLDLTPSILLTGRFETHVERVITSLIRPGNKVVDVGANVGYHTLAIADAVGPAGQVYAFEANPDVMRILKATMVFNGFTSFRGTGRVNLYGNAVLDEPRAITFAMAAGHFGSGHVLSATDNDSAYSARVDVVGVTLDGVLGAETGPIDLLHMDIEGSEPLAVRGAQALIERSPDLKIVTEWSISMMRDHADVGEYATWLSRQGLKIRLIEHTGGLPEIETASLLTLPHCDLLLSRD